jgi:hypothetical protein
MPKRKPKVSARARPRAASKVAASKRPAKRSRRAAPAKTMVGSRKAAAKRAVRPQPRRTAETSVERRLRELQARARAQQNRIQSLEKRLDTRVRREEAVLGVLGLEPSRMRMGEKGTIGELQRILLKNEELLLSSNKRMESILTALKNHREVLIRLNKRVYKEGAREQMRLELAVMQNTLQLLGMGGFEFDQTLVGDIRRLKGLLEKDDAEMSKIRKRKETLDKKFETELQKFDLESAYQKKKDIPGYI